MLVPNTALKERPKPGSERSFPEIEAAAASNGHRDREEEAASKPSRQRSKRRQSSGQLVNKGWRIKEQKCCISWCSGNIRPCHTNLGGLEGQGIFSGERTLGNFRNSWCVSWHSALRDVEHVTRVLFLTQLSCLPWLHHLDWTQRWTWQYLLALWTYERAHMRGATVRPWNKTQGSGGKSVSAFLLVLEGPWWRGAWRGWAPWGSECISKSLLLSPTHPNPPSRSPLSSQKGQLKEQ